MKKFSVIALAMTATLALGACSTEDEPTENTTPVEQTEDTTTSDDTAGQTSDDMAGQTGDSAGQTGDSAGQTGDSAGATGDAASYADPSCAEFFTEGGPLADRAEAARAALDAGEITDGATASEVTLLKSRLDATAEAAPEDISALIAEVNAPFTEVVDTINEASEDVVNPETGEITLPEIDTAASADAQTELETACAG